MTVKVEPRGQIVRGLAVPYDQPARLRNSDGVWFTEIVDELSFRELPSGLPIMVEHNRSREPVGRVLNLEHTRYGLGMEGELVGSDSELEGWARRFAKGLSAGLSVSFRAPRFDYRPSDGNLPVRRLRDAELIEVSLVQHPAYRGAEVTSLSVRSAADEIRHHESEKAIMEARQTAAEVDAYLAKKRS